MTVTARGRGRPRDEAIDAAVLEAAIDELIERGFQAASMESVAERAGIAKTTLYRRWPNREELAVAAMQRFEEPVDRPVDGTVREQLLALLDAMRRKWNDPRYAAVMRRAIAEGVSDPAMYRRTRDRLIGPHVRAMNTVLRRAVAEGIVAADVDIDWTRQMLVAPILASALTLKDRVSRDQIERTLDAVLRGLAPPAQ